MKKRYLIYIGTIIPSICFAETRSEESGDLFITVLSAVFIFIIIFIVWIFIDTNRENKRIIKRKGTRLTVEEKTIVKKNMDYQKKYASKEKENESLNNEIVSRDKEIESLNNQIASRDKIIESLTNQIASLRDVLHTEKISLDKSSPNSEAGKSDDNTEDEGDQRDNSKLDNSDEHSFYMTVVNGNLVKAESEQTTYYFTWCEKGDILFKFVNNDRTRTAINNRTIIIEPFCIKLENSKSPDSSEVVETITPGILNEDYSLRKKAEIIFK